MRRLKMMITGLALALASMFGVLATGLPAMAKDSCPNGTARAGASVDNLADCNLPKTTNKNKLENRTKDIINVALGAMEVVAVIIIIYGGVVFTTSRGDPEKTKKAKNTILYGVIGLAIGLLAFAIVNFVLTESKLG